MMCKEFYISFDTSVSHELLLQNISKFIDKTERFKSDIDIIKINTKWIIDAKSLLGICLILEDNGKYLLRINSNDTAEIDEFNKTFEYIKIENEKS